VAEGDVSGADDPMVGNGVFVLVATLRRERNRP
jgi:hypothetical protein